ncbi:MAG: hypothetical protein OIN87_03665 [Candidatus Methanoperedens sp.]|nr:hypothetical protein [Candidatus Methanoperedens sp.]
MKNFIQSESAVSESVSFVLTLGIVLISSAIVYYSGAPILEKSEKNAHFQEMENTFIYLSQNIDKVGYERAPIRVTELKIYGGTLTIGHKSTITIGGIKYNVSSLEYIFEDRTLAYENTGVWVKYPNGAVIMVSNPSFSPGNITTIPVMELIGDYWTGGEGNIRIKNKLYSTSINSVNAVNRNVSVEINSSYYMGWKKYLEDIGGMDIVVNDSRTTVTSNLTVDSIMIDSNQIITEILDA